MWWTPVAGIILQKFYFFQLFKGIFFYCDGPQLQRLQIKNKDDCLTHSGSGHKWVNHKYNFDNLGKDIYIPSTYLEILTIISTLESKGQFISSFHLNQKSKNQRKYFCISALMSKTLKKWLEQKIKAQKE